MGKKRRYQNFRSNNRRRRDTKEEEEMAPEKRGNKSVLLMDERLEFWRVLGVVRAVVTTLLPP